MSSSINPASRPTSQQVMASAAASSSLEGNPAESSSYVDITTYLYEDVSVVFDGLSEQMAAIGLNSIAGTEQIRKTFTEATQSLATLAPKGIISASTGRKILPFPMQQFLFSKSKSYLMDLFKDYAQLEPQQMGSFTLAEALELAYLTLFTELFQKKTCDQTTHDDVLALIEFLIEKGWSAEKGAELAEQLFMKVAAGYKISDEHRSKCLTHLNKIKGAIPLTDFYNTPIDPTITNWEICTPFYQFLIDQTKTLMLALSPLREESINGIKESFQRYKQKQTELSKLRAVQQLNTARAIITILDKKIQNLDRCVTGKLEELERNCHINFQNPKSHSQVHYLLALGGHSQKQNERTIKEFNDEITKYGIWYAISSGEIASPASLECINGMFEQLKWVAIDCFTQMSQCALDQPSIDLNTFTPTPKNTHLFFLLMAEYLEVAVNFSQTKAQKDPDVLIHRRKLEKHSPPALKHYISLSLEKFYLQIMRSAEKVLSITRTYYDDYSYGDRIPDSPLSEIIKPWIITLRTTANNLKGINSLSSVGGTSSSTFNQMISTFLQQTAILTTQSSDFHQQCITKTKENFLQLLCRMTKIDHVSVKLSIQEERDSIQTMSKSARSLKGIFDLIYKQSLNALSIATKDAFPLNLAEKTFDDAWLDAIDIEEMRTQNALKKVRKSSREECKESEAFDLDKSIQVASSVSSASSKTPRTIAHAPLVTLSPSIYHSPVTTTILQLREKLCAFHAVKGSFSTPHLVNVNSPKRIALMQQLFSIDHIQWTLEMWEKCQNSEQKHLLAEQFLFWGYLSIEQGLTAQYVQANGSVELFHGLSALMSKAPAEINNEWPKVCDRGSLYLRYPSSCYRTAFGNKQKTLSLQLIAEKENRKPHHIPSAIDLFQKTLPILIKDFISIQVTPLTLNAPPLDSKEHISTLQSLLKQPADHYRPHTASPPAVSSASASSASLLKDDLKEKPLLKAADESLYKARTTLEKTITQLETDVEFSGQPQANNELTSIRNIAHHLHALSTLPSMFGSFPEQRFLGFHAHTLFMTMQYFIENLGVTLSIRAEDETHTHQLSYYDAYGLCESLNDKELALIKELDVGKGLEYPFKYFSATYQAIPSNCVKRMSTLYSVSKAATLAEEGFSPEDLPGVIISELKEELQAKLLVYAKLVEKLIERHFKG